jgi:HK97 family phage major capsid protein
MSKVVELRGKLEELRTKAAAAFAEAGDELDMEKVASIEGDSAAKAAQLKTWNDEMTGLAKEIEEIDGLSLMKKFTDDLGEIDGHPGHQTGGLKDRGAEATKTIGELFVESDAYLKREKGAVGPETNVPIDVKTLFQTSAGWAPFNPRGPKVVDFATRPISVVDLFPQGATTAAAIVYMEETTFTNAAVEVSEGLAKPEATLALTERSEPVRKIAVWLPVTDEQLEDVPQAQSYVENRLGFMVRQRLDLQLLVGDGTAPNISGILDRSGLQTQAKGADPTPDAVYKAMTKIRVNAFSEPNAAVFHPNDWQDIRLLRTADGIYIWGNPADAGPERIWGLSVAQSTALTENTGLVGDFAQSELVMRKGVTVQVGFINDDFQKNRQSIRAELRAALAVYRPAAFCSVTGI